MSGLNLREADKMEILVLVDNYTDVLLLQSTDVLKRPPVLQPEDPLAEHGLSCLIKVSAGSEEYTILYDTGRSAHCFLHNAHLFKVDLSKIDCVVLSHGHFDHFGGLLQVLHMARKGIPLIVHPDAFLQRRFDFPTPGLLYMPPLFDEIYLNQTGAVLRKVREATTLCSDLILATGEVERTTDFEKGFPLAQVKINGRWVVDPFYDDQGVAVNVKGKGLVVIGGCSHAGIINTVKHTQKVSRIEKVHAILGGFHLTGPIFEPIIGQTIEEMKKIGPDFVVPMHCTGWKAINQFSKEMPDQFLLNSVGTTYVFQ